MEFGGAGILEDGGAVKGDDVDSAHLLGNHDGESGEGGAANTRDGEEFNEALGIVGAGEELMLDFQLRVDVEHIAGNLDRVVAQLDHGFPGFWVAALLHVPARGLGAKIDEQKQGHGGNEGGTEHEAPVDVGAGVEDGKVKSSSQEDAEGCPHFWKGLVLASFMSSIVPREL